MDREGGSSWKMSVTVGESKQIKTLAGDDDVVGDDHVDDDEVDDNDAISELVHVKALQNVIKLTVVSSAVMLSLFPVMTHPNCVTRVLFYDDEIVSDALPTTNDENAPILFHSCVMHSHICIRICTHKIL